MNRKYPFVASNETTKLSPWVTLNAKHVVKENCKETSVYHSLKQSDYVTMFVMRSDGLIPVVRQYRPAVEEFTIEFPGGLLDRESSPESVAISEIFEETGHNVIGEPQLLGCLYPDTGRLENRFWAFYADVGSDISTEWTPESDVEVNLISKQELHNMICNGRFNHALHLGLIGLALTKGLLTW